MSTGTTCAISSRLPAKAARLAAGRALRVSQTTVARRIAALEAALGFPLFEKRQAGYVLMPAGEELLERAEEVERAAILFAIRGLACPRLSGTVRVTTEEIYALSLIAPLLPRSAPTASGHPDRAGYRSGDPRPRRRRSRHRVAQQLKGATRGSGRPKDLRRRLDALLQPRLCGATRRPEIHPGPQKTPYCRRRRRQFVAPL